jgi:hypothetical protein
MATQMKSFDCKYCDISGLNRRQYFSHTRSQEHKNMFELARQDAKIRTILTVNKLTSSTRTKYTKDGEFTNKMVCKWLDEKDQK